MSGIVIVDTGLCNLDSIARAIEECGGSATVTTDPRELGRASRIVLPGVGAFAAAMTKLRASGLADALSEEVLHRGIPFLGICLGMQLLAQVGHEGTPTQGLGWVEGSVRLLQPTGSERIPHIGWNEVIHREGAALFRGIDQGRDFYFVHSYALVPGDRADVVATTPYAGSFVSAIQHDLIFGVQFHPEKSQRPGLAVLRNFLAV